MEEHALFMEGKHVTAGVTAGAGRQAVSHRAGRTQNAEVGAQANGFGHGSYSPPPRGRGQLGRGARRSTHDEPAGHHGSGSAAGRHVPSIAMLTVTRKMLYNQPESLCTTTPRPPLPPCCLAC